MTTGSAFILMDWLVLELESLLQSVVPVCPQRTVLCWCCPTLLPVRPAPRRMCACVTETHRSATVCPGGVVSIHYNNATFHWSEFNLKGLTSNQDSQYTLFILYFYYFSRYTFQIPTMPLCSGWSEATLIIQSMFPTYLYPVPFYLSSLTRV